MKQQEILEQFEDCPVVAAIKDEQGLKQCLESEIGIVFVLYGDICNIGDIVERLKKGGKTVLVHIDLIGGLSSREVAVDFFEEYHRGRRCDLHQAGNHQTGKGTGAVRSHAFFCH